MSCTKCIIIAFAHTILQENPMCDVNPSSIDVEYSFQYSDMQNCPPSAMSNPLDQISVTIPANGTAQNVLEASVGVSREYQFTATYFGSTLGYFIDTINGTSSNNPCFWFFYFQAPGQPGPVLSNLGVSNFIIPTSGYSIFMQYEKFNAEHDSSPPANDTEVCAIIFYILVFNVLRYLLSHTYRLYC